MAQNRAEKKAISSALLEESMVVYSWRWVMVI